MPPAPGEPPTSIGYPETCEKPAKPAEFLLRISNKGNASSHFNLDYDPPKVGWRVEFYDLEGNKLVDHTEDGLPDIWLGVEDARDCDRRVDGWSLAEVVARVTPPELSLPGAEFVTDIIVEPVIPAGALLCQLEDDSATIRTVVGEVYDLVLEPNRAERGTPPCGTVAFHVVVENCGNVEDTYRLTLGPVPLGWKVNITDSYGHPYHGILYSTGTQASVAYREIKLEAGETELLVVNITPPCNTPPGARANILLQLTSLNDPAENEAAELVVTVTTAASSPEGQPPGSSSGGAESLENAEQQASGQKQKVGTTEKKRGKAKPMKTS